MSFQVSAAPKSIQNNAEKNSTRRSANYLPSIWGDHFLSYANNDSKATDDDSGKHQELKEEIRRMLKADITTKPSSQKLDLIDAVQRLGVSYHFESEIEEILEKIQDCDLKEDDDLHYISLKFRLLRQDGFKISANVFNKFTDNDGNFNESLVGDVRGVLSLYEASHLSVHGENILDEALAFTTSHLKSVATQISTPLAKQVKQALIRPIRKSLPRLGARQYMPIYQEDPSHNEPLLTFAKLDFNKLQKLHQKELSDISLWWKDLDFTHKLPFARDRIVELYFWMTEGLYFEPEYSLARKMMTKVISMVSVIDDTYDVYGELEELEPFTVAIQRWDISAMDQLPEYMQPLYRAILDVYSEIENYLANQGKLYCLHYAKEVIKTLAKNYLVEAQWFHQNYVPPMEEYMPVALETCGYRMLSTNSYVGMGDIVNNESFKWVLNNPKIVMASSLINRLMDDIVSHKFEQSRGHVASSVECYMKQYGATEEEVCNLFRKQVSDAWKDINEEFLRPTAVPKPLLMRVLNLTRFMDVLYKEEDGYSNPGVGTKDMIASILTDPMPIS